MDGDTFPYMVFAVVIIMAIAIPIFACVRWILVKKNWVPANATIEGTRCVVRDKRRVLIIDLTYVFDDILYLGSTELSRAKPDDYIAGANIAVLINPNDPCRFNRDRDYFFQQTKIAKWLESKLTERGEI